MQHLPLPATAAEDDAVLARLAKDPDWAPHEADWIAAYGRYRQNQGNPFAINPHDFGEDVGDLQYKLYDTRKRSGELARMRRKKGLLSCPVCGSPVTGDLDHYLPRGSYPEFSIMRVNLVPACTHCNSGVKGGTVHGGAPRRFIHPYYDQWADQPLWSVEIVPPFEAATFRPTPVPDLPEPQDQIVAFHLNHVLGDQFHRSMENEWSTYPRQIGTRRPAPDLNFVLHQVGIDLEVAVIARGHNSWLAALLRGLGSNAAALQYVQQHAA